MSVLVIAEVGVNHDGEMAVARELIAAAAHAGANVVKFQTFNADSLVVPSAAAAPYQAAALGAGINQHEMLRRLQLTADQHRQLAEECRLHQVEFASTAFDAAGLSLLVQLGVARLKVPSGEITNVPLLRTVAGAGKPVLLSTGMSTLDEIGFALGVLEQAGLPRRMVTLLHCTTSYPTPPGDVNLRVLPVLQHAFGTAIGYSDHTIGMEVAVAAVALGAAVIEKHITLSRRRVGPDHAASTEPQEFAAMVQAIRNIEAAVGDRIKRPAPSEQPNIAAARRSIVAARPIKRGDLLSAENLTCKRPAAGISAARWDQVVGTTAVRDFRPDEFIEL
jgi:N-acetylneuraminate synthase